MEITEIGNRPVYCGRTDAGVSADSMVLNFQVKSRFENPDRSYILTRENYEEYPDDKMINEKSPEDLRITGYPLFLIPSARHTCIQREYRYYFVLNDFRSR